MRHFYVYFKLCCRECSPTPERMNYVVLEPNLQIRLTEVFMK